MMEGKKRYTFSPALYIQRYKYVLGVLGRLKFPVDKVVDFGCAEGRLLVRILRTNPNIRHLIGVDNYKAVLEEACTNLKPIGADYIFRRTHALKIDIFCGDCTVPDNRLQNIDALTCIELIEHLEPDCLVRFPRTVFGILRPRVVVISTPNKEFNVVMGMQDHEIRHSDHKFEWTRTQFQHWCEQIVAAFPNYGVTFDGVGESSDHPQVGFCSQFAVFQAHELMHQHSCNENHLQLVDTIHYPYKEVSVDTECLDNDVCSGNESDDESLDHDDKLSHSNLEDSWFRVKAMQ